MAFNGVDNEVFVEDFEDEGEYEDEFVPVPDAEKTPVTIVTGFLGSGKTTLVNYILTEKHGKRIAVIENEFGEVNIDQSLVGAKLAMKEDIISMDNGCVCCTVRGDLVRALNAIMQRRSLFDAVLIETTGMADPAPVAFTFNTNEQIGDAFRLDGILTLVDAKHVEQHLDEKKPDGAVNEAIQQVAFADRILLNKIDLVTPAEKKHVRERLNDINSYAKIVECQNSRVNLDELLGIGAFSLERALEIDEYEEEEEEEEECHDANCGHDHHHDHKHSEHSHNEHSHGHGHKHEHDKGDCKDPECKDKEHGHSHEQDNGHTDKEHGHGHGNEHNKDDCKDSECKDKEHSHGHGHEHQEGKRKAEAEGGKKKKKRKRHDTSLVGSVGISCPGELDQETFQEFMEVLLEAQSANIYRTKGILFFPGRPAMVMQGVHEQILYGPLEEDLPPEKCINKIVFIGKELNREELEAGFKECIIPEQ